ncbi:MAG: hypothetical protein JXP72_00330, partial [Coriobacteriia bacterium]|nr:hypothetical protein [Coriobacteriia bacterium]
MRRHLLIPAALALTLTLLIPTTALAWSNGPDDGAGYGTHDWVLDEALDLVSAPWVDRDVALSTTHWPDMVYGSGDVMNHVFKPDGDGRGGPQTVADRYYDLVTAYKAGDYAEASRQLGLLSHYFSDLAVVYHVQTTDGDATEAAEHLQYELDVDSNHRKPGNVSDWITPTSRVTVTDIRKKTVDLAVATRGTYSSLRTAYKANGLSGTALTITKQNLSRAVNGLADIIAAVPSGAGVSGPGTLTASARKLYVANNLNVAMYADCVDSAGNPLEGVRVEFTWPLKAGTVTDIEFTDATGRATSWVILGNETLGEKIEVTASATSGGQTSSDSAVVIPTDVIDYIKTGISNYAPWQNTQVTAHVVCLNADGEPIPDLPVTFTWTHSSTTVVYKTTTNRFGLAWHRRSIGMASTDYRVRVDAVVEAGNTIRSNYATFLPQANPTASPFSPSGVSGDNRYATSATISRRAFPNGASTVVIATGRNFPDALGGAAL